MGLIDWFKGLFGLGWARIDTEADCKRLREAIDRPIGRAIKERLRDIADPKHRSRVRTATAGPVQTFMMHCEQGDLGAARRAFPAVIRGLQKAERTLNMPRGALTSALRAPGIKSSDEKLADEIFAAATANAVSGTPIDREAATAAVRRLYAAHELPLPANILFLADADCETRLHNLDAARGESSTIPVANFGDVIRDWGEKEKPLRLMPFFMRAYTTFGMELGPGRFRRFREGTTPPALQAVATVLQQMGRDANGIAEPSNIVGGSNHYQDVVFVEFARRTGTQLPEPILAKIEALRLVMETCGVVNCRTDHVIVGGRPVEAHFDSDNRLHREDGPALVVSGGRGFHFWHGVMVPERLIAAPQSLTAADILAETNQEIRRVMIERKGAEAFIREAGAKEVHRDDTGVLWRVEFTPEIRLSDLFAKTGYANLTSEERQMLTSRFAEDPWRDILQQGDIWQAVEVVNATAEPDGTFRHYFLAVPPEMQTAREAVAWTFGMTGEEYRPEVEK